MNKKRIKQNFSIKQKNLGVLLIFIVVGIILFRIIVLNPPPLTGHFTKDGTTYSCVNCTDCTLAIADASPGDTINLTADISDVYVPYPEHDACIDFAGKDDLIFDCQGYMIDGIDSGPAPGIALANTDNIIIRNCNISDFSDGIDILGEVGNNITLQNIISNSNQNGIYGASSLNSTFINITANDNSQSGIYFASSSNNNVLTNITANSNTNHGIWLASSSHNNLTNIKVNSNSEKGIYFSSGANNTLTNITANSNQHGIHFTSNSNNNILIGITSNSNFIYGIYIDASLNNTLTNITSNSNNNYGILLSACSNHTLTNITAQENAIYDISVSTSQDSHCNNNLINMTGSGGRPIEYYNSSATIENKELSQLILCNADGSTVNNVTVSGSDTISNNLLYVYRTDNSSLSNINSSNNRFGIYLVGSSNNTFTNITSNDNSQHGIYFVSSSNNNTLTNITSNDNSQQGIYLSASSNNTFTDIASNSNRYGISLESSSNNNSLQNITSNSNTDYGIYLSASSSNSLTNITSNSNNRGFYVLVSNNNTLTNIQANDNINYGIQVTSSSGNIFSNITVQENTDIDFFLTATEDSHCQNNFTNITGSGGRAIEYYNSSATIENKELSQLILCNADSSTVNNVTVSGSDTKFNNGLFMFRTENASLIDINTSKNHYGLYIRYSGCNNFTSVISNFNSNTGVYMDSSNNNTFVNITFNNNDQHGIWLVSSSDNLLTDIATSSNGVNGIYLYTNSDYNIINDSRIENNTQNGIRFFHSGSDYPENNSMYNNFFNNTINYYNSTNLTNYFNTTKTLGTNIISGSYIGGNYWGYPNGTGFSDTCTDSSGADGFCDSAYSLDGDNYDYLPLAGTCTESWTCTDWSTCVSSLQTRTCTDSNSCGTTTTKPAISQSCTVTGGSAPPGITADQPTVTYSWDVVEPETPLEMEITESGIDITTITVDVSETVTSVSIKVTEIDVVPLSDLKISLDGDTYQSFQIDVTGINDTNIESVVIDFKVNKTWLDESGIIEDIVLYRKQDKGNKWDELITTFVSSDDDYYYFTSTSSGFSSFTIALKIARMIECIPEERKCIGNILQQCSTNGMVWETIETCDYKCRRNKCVAKFEFPVLIFYMITVVLSVGILIVIFVGYRYFSKKHMQKVWEKSKGTQRMLENK